MRFDVRGAPESVCIGNGRSFGAKIIVLTSGPADIVMPVAGRGVLGIYRCYT